mgnify:CR=1 FL=1
MVRAGDFRNGITVEYKDDVFQIIEFQHVKPGKGSPFVRTKLKNVRTGNVIEDTFAPDDKLPKAHIETAEMQYLYSDGDFYYFMNTETYDQISMSKDQIGNTMKFVKEQESVKVSSFKGEIFAVEPPTFVELRITDTEPGFKGNTATGATKPATVETGAQVKVPLFVDIDDVIKIDTRTGEYLSRA